MCAARQRSRSVGNFSTCSTHLSRVVIRLLISTQALLSCFLARATIWNNRQLIKFQLPAAHETRWLKCCWLFTASRHTTRATVYNRQATRRRRAMCGRAMSMVTQKHDKSEASVAPIRQMVCDRGGLNLSERRQQHWKFSTPSPRKMKKNCWSATTTFAS